MSDTIANVKRKWHNITQYPVQNSANPIARQIYVMLDETNFNLANNGRQNLIMLNFSKYRIIKQSRFITPPSGMANWKCGNRVNELAQSILPHDIFRDMSLIIDRYLIKRYYCAPGSCCHPDDCHRWLDGVATCQCWGISTHIQRHQVKFDINNWASNFRERKISWDRRKEPSSKFPTGCYMEKIGKVHFICKNILCPYLSNLMIYNMP